MLIRDTLKTFKLAGVVSFFCFVQGFAFTNQANAQVLDDPEIEIYDQDYDGPKPYPPSRGYERPPYSFMDRDGTFDRNIRYGASPYLKRGSSWDESPYYQDDYWEDPSVWFDDHEYEYIYDDYYAPSNYYAPYNYYAPFNYDETRRPNSTLPRGEPHRALPW